MISTIKLDNNNTMKEAHVLQGNIGDSRMNSAQPVYETLEEQQQPPEQ